VIALIDANARVIHVQAVEPAGDPRGDVGEARLVVVDLADHADLAGNELPRDLRRLDVHEGFRALADGEFARSRNRIAGRRYRDEIHPADGTLTGLVLADLGMHRTGPDLLSGLRIRGMLMARARGRGRRGSA